MSVSGGDRGGHRAGDGRASVRRGAYRWLDPRGPPGRRLEWGRVIRRLAHHQPIAVLVEDDDVEEVAVVVEEHLHHPKVTRASDAAEGGRGRGRMGEAKLPDVLLAADHLTRLGPLNDQGVRHIGVITQEGTQFSAEDRPSETAQAAIWAREPNPSLARMCWTWFSAVRSETNRVRAISRLVTPRATSTATSRSRLDSRTGAVGVVRSLMTASARARSTLIPRAVAVRAAR